MHLIADSADRRTICGLDIRHARAMPFMLAAFLPRYRDAWRERGEVRRVCPDCERGA